MKAVILHKFSSPMLLSDLEPPRIGSNEVLVKVKACGICHTDLKIFDGSVPTVKLPRVLGHEIAGEVVEIGEKVTNINRGDPVIVYPYVTCGICYFCRTSMENYCVNLFYLGRLGFELDGGLSEYVKCPSANVFKFSSNVPFEKIAVLPDAIAVPFHAIKRSGRVTAGEDVAVVGLGGIGVHAIQIARSCGANVYGITSSPHKLDIARQFHIENIICSSEVNVAEKVSDATGGKGVDVVVDTVGTRATLNQDLKIVRSGGRVVIIGYEYGENFELPVQQVVYNGIEIIGSRGCIKQDIVEVIKLVEMGTIQPVVSKIFDLEEVNAAMEYLRKERPFGRVVIRV
jgi:propanol-preferring alcohol dehydrogenase